MSANIIGCECYDILRNSARALASSGASIVPLLSASKRLKIACQDSTYLKMETNLLSEGQLMSKCSRHDIVLVYAYCTRAVHVKHAEQELYRLAFELGLIAVDKSLLQFLG